jgi:hypothetical protein
MGAGGIIHQRASVLLVAVTEACLYDSLSGPTKAKVDAIDNKAPDLRTAADIITLMAALREAVSC